MSRLNSKSQFYLGLFFLTLLVAYWKYSSTKTEFIRPLGVVQTSQKDKPKQRKMNPIRIPPPKSTSDLLKTQNITPAPPSTSTPVILTTREDLESIVNNRATATQEQLESALLLADDLASDDPNNYEAYKYKLLTLLTLETKHGAEPNFEEYDRLYNELLQFRSENELRSLVNLVDETNDVPLTFNSDEIQTIDPDLIHIPFMRLSALNRIEELSDYATDYITEYPQSPIGHYYLAESLWRNGQKEEALESLRNSLSQNTSEEIVLRLFNEIQKNPVDRLNSIK